MLKLHPCGPREGVHSHLPAHILFQAAAFSQGFLSMGHLLLQREPPQISAEILSGHRWGGETLRAEPEVLVLLQRELGQCL